ncbi:MAG TPA: toll/interleukin-1 receptor domain-containing protein [Thermoanaerobaculia bacterium]|nr:toll/interleukin-1 receptor domain-containing protein [Thermoanaerobaculia bacterium]
MIPEIRHAYNRAFTPEKYQALEDDLVRSAGCAPGFRICETPLFLSEALARRLTEAAHEVLAQVTSESYLKESVRAVPPALAVPGEEAHPVFLQIDFALVPGEDGELVPQLIELQGFPSLYGFQWILEKSFRRCFEAIPAGFTPYFSGLGPESYVSCLKDVIVGDCDPENVVLLEIDPEKQKTRIDFTATEKLIGIPTVSATGVVERGGRLYYPKGGREVPIHRVYNRVIFDEVERKGLDLSHIFKRDLDVTWVGHPNWYLRISKFSLPFIESRYAPKAWFVSDLHGEYPQDLENYVLKPLFSFAGLGVEMGPTPERLRALPNPADFILQRKVDYAPCVETPGEPAKAEVRMMFVRTDRPRLVNNLVRMSKGKMMGVDFNKEKTWVGASLAYHPGIVERLTEEMDYSVLATRPEGTARGLEEPESSGALPPEPAHLPPDKPLVTHENVKFTVYKPRTVAPLEWYPLLAFAHLEDLAEEPGQAVGSIEEEIRAQAEQALGDRLPAYADDSEDSLQAIPSEAEITFVPTIPGFRFNPPQATFLWLEAIHREEFRMQAAPQLDGQTARGRLSVYWGRILLAELNLKIRVDSRLVESAPAAATEREASRPYQDIFASYSHKDTAIVLEFERYVKTLGHRYLIDRSHLRAGEVWDERLQGMIREADAFQLFWSRNSMRSEFVQKEWSYALSLKRDSFVRPTYWEEPLPEMPDRGIPPPELKKLHFHLFSGAPAAPAAAAAAPPGTAAGQASVPAPPAPLPPKPRPRKLVWAGSLAAALFAVILVVGLFPSAKIEQGSEGIGTLVESVTIGRSVRSDGTMPEEARQESYAPGEAVIAAVPVEELPAGEKVRVVWIGPDGTPVSEETKQVEAGDASLDFWARRTRTWDQGNYRAEVWVGSEKVTERSFEINAVPAPPPPY